MAKHNETGKLGEKEAVEYLEQKDYQIVEKNFHCRRGEIDIIAWDENKQELVFVEVKTRTSTLFGRPAEAIDRRKQEHMLKAVQYYLFRKHLENIAIRIDVIEVYQTSKENYQINHLKQAIEY